MPERTTIRRARRDKRQGKAATTQAGEFVREEMEHVKRGKHGAKSRRQVVAIGLSKARRAGVDLPPPGEGKAKPRTRKSAARSQRKGRQQGELRSAARRKPGRSRKTSTRRGRSSAGRSTRKASRRSSSARRTSTRRGSSHRTKRSSR